MKTNSIQAPSTLIPEYIGSDFDAVLEVASNIEAVKVVAENIENFKVFPASETTAGIAEIATQAEVNQKTSDSHIVTPKKLGEYAAPLVHTHATATSIESGFLAATDKQKLDGIASNANNYTHPIGDGNLHVPATGTGNNGKLLKAGITAGSLVWDTISKDDVGLSNVDNTSDLNKPISAAAQAALDGKSATTHMHTAMDVGAAPLVHTHGITDVTGLQAVLDGKSATEHAHSYLPLTGGTLTGALSGTTFTGALTGNASTATSAGKLTAARTISLTGDVIGSALFDGSTDVTFTTTYKSSGVTAGTYKSVTVDDKGYITAGSNPTTLSEYGITDAINTSACGVANGVATLNASGLVPSTQLPSYVDDVLEYEDLAALPVTGEASKIYVTLGDNKIFRWTGSAYIEISPVAGNSDSAIKLATARTISTTGDATWAVSFDGSANVSSVITLANSGASAGTYRSVTVDSKGRVTSGANPTTLAAYGITDAQPKDNTLTALAGVTTAADKLIYATAPDVFTTTSITPFARTLIDDVDAAAMRTTLGIDELPVRSFIGDTPPINPWNGVTWYCTDDGRTYVYYADADSTQWVENSPQNPANTDTLSGTNVNGNYAQFADGTLICWVSTTTSAAATKAITYPMAFISAPVCTVTVEATTPSIVTTQSPSVTGISINGWNMSSARIAVACKIMAVGRWR